MSIRQAARAQTPAASVPSFLVLISKHLRKGTWTGRTVTTNGKPAAGGGSQAENPLAALLGGIPDFNTEELEDMLYDLPTPDDANQAAGMTMAEAVEVS